MGFPKALLPYRGSTFLEYLALLLDAQPVEPLLVVLGHEPERIRGAVALPDRAQVLLNPAYRLGQLSSLQAAIGAIANTTPAGLLVAPVDHPCLDGPLLSLLIRTFIEETPDVLVPVYGGRRGHPVIFSAGLFAELLEAPLDQGARAVVRRHAVRQVPVQTQGVLLDVDDPEIYRRVIQRDSAGE